jgi:hypothetical protein
LSRNGIGGVYTGSEAQRAAGQQAESETGLFRADTENSGYVLYFGRDDLSPDQISGRRGRLYPGQVRNVDLLHQPFTSIYGETAKDYVPPKGAKII